MKEPLHVQLLKQFNGIGQPLDIADFIKANFTLPSAVYAQNKVKNFSPVSIFIDDLKQRGVIATENENYQKWVYYEENSFVYPQYESEETNNKLYYYLTSEGLDYLDSYENNTTSLRANKHIIANVWIAVVMSGIVIVVSILSYSISRDAYNKVVEQSKSDSIHAINVDKRLDTLTHMLQKLQQSLTSSKKK